MALPIPLGRRRIELLARIGTAAATPARRILFVGTALTLLFIGFAEVNLADRGGLWEDAHWTVSAIVATWAAYIGSRGVRGPARDVRLWLAIGLGVWALGQVAWDVQDVIGLAMAPTPADLIFLASSVPVAVTLWVGVHRRMTRAEEIAVYLDAATVLFTVGAVWFVVFRWAIVSPALQALPSFAGLPQWFSLVTQPIIFTAATGAAIIGSVALGLRLSLRGSWALVVGLVMLSIATTGWLIGSASGGPQVGSPLNVLFSAGLLILGYGGTTWTTDCETRPRLGRLMVELGSFLPLAASGTATLLLLTEDSLQVDPVRPIFLAGTGLAIASTVIRQTLLLRERDRMARELERVNRQARGALEDQAASEAEHRKRAEQMARVLAASEGLTVAHDAPDPALDDPFGRALSYLAPEGVSACLSRWDPTTRSLTRIAIHGDAGPIAIGEARGYDGLPLEWQRVIDGGRAAIYRRPASTGRASGSSDETPAAAPSAHLVLPLHDRNGAMLGVLHLEDPAGVRTIEPTFVDLARLMANQLAVALENGRLVTQLTARIAEMDRVQAQLIASSKRSAVGELAAAVAHEVNNPLTGVLGYTELLLAEAARTNAPSDDLEVIRAEALRARAIVRSLMEFARPRAPERHPADLVELVRGTLDLMRYHLERGGVTIVEDYAELPDLDLDADAIRQALLNVINNAVLAIATNGHLTIATRIDRDRAVVTIVDDGEGMTGATLEQAFVPFFTTRDTHEGTGLGLSVTQGIVEAHGGSVRLSSAPGVGTTVEIRLPLTAVPSIAAPRARQEIPA